ncbi:DUF1992 domain-containing protein [Dietzia sp.]|uniref:DnaJ family domain-containing protein n=1 Tax=Dietzia sp. TaxID=1871616 RepID=UPI002FD8D258
MTAEEPESRVGARPGERDGAVPRRKPPGVAFETFVERQIRQATERGDFDNLPGAGKPLPKRGGDGDDWWIRQYAEREGLTGHEFLPPALRLRRERELLPGKARDCHSEREVEALAAAYNRDVAEFIRRGVGNGPNLPVSRVDPRTLIATWREGRRDRGR